MADSEGRPSRAHLIFSATEFKDLAGEHFWAIKLPLKRRERLRTFKSVACSGNFEHRGWRGRCKAAGAPHHRERNFRTWLSKLTTA